MTVKSIDQLKNVLTKLAEDNQLGTVDVSLLTDPEFAAELLAGYEVAANFSLQTFLQEELHRRRVAQQQAREHLNNLRVECLEQEQECMRTDQEYEIIRQHLILVEKEAAPMLEIHVSD